MTVEIDIDDRLAKEAELLAAQSFMPLSDIAAKMGISESTVRRDLQVLEGQGIARRTHGGAVFVRDGSVGAAGSEVAGLAEKQAIARAVAELIPLGQTVMLNGGTTCQQIAKSLVGRRLNIVTNSVSAAALLCTDSTSEVTLIGGYVYPRIGVAVGAMAEHQLENMHAGRFITSCAGLTEDGPFEPNQMMADLEQRMMHSADETILAADHAKLGVRSVVRLCELAQIDVIVTDSAASPEARAWLDRSGVRVIYAGEKSAECRVSSVESKTQGQS